MSGREPYPYLSKSRKELVASPWEDLLRSRSLAMHCLTVGGRRAHPSVAYRAALADTRLPCCVPVQSASRRLSLRPAQYRAKQFWDVNLLPRGNVAHRVHVARIHLVGPVLEHERYLVWLLHQVREVEVSDVDLGLMTRERLMSMFCCLRRTVARRLSRLTTSNHWLIRAECLQPCVMSSLGDR